MAIEKIRVNGVDYDLGVSSGSEGSGSGSGMPDIAWNNPDLPNLYYGMGLQNKSKIVIDFTKMAEWLNTNDTEWKGIMDNTQSTGSNARIYNSNIIRLCSVSHEGVDSSNNVAYLEIRVNHGGSNVYVYCFSSEFNTKTLFESANANGTITYRDGFEEFGVIEIDFETLASNFTIFDKTKFITAAIMDDTNLNTHPIDFITIE